MISSNLGRDAFNAIDRVVVDDAGTPWMAFGRSGAVARMVELERPDGVAR